MMVSGKVANWTPCLPSSRIFLTTFSTVPCRLYSTGLICTAAALTMVLTLFSFRVTGVGSEIGGGGAGQDGLDMIGKRGIHDQLGCGLVLDGDERRGTLTLRNSGTGKPPQPQFSSSTSSITTKVESSGLCSTSSRS